MVVAVAAVLVAVLAVGAALVLTGGEDAPDEDAEAEATSSPLPTFGTGEVLEVVDHRLGPTNASVLLLAEDADSGTERSEVLQACAAFYEERYGAFTCYLYGSREALEAANVNEETGELEMACWEATLVRDESGSGQGKLENPEPDPDCPA